MLGIASPHFRRASCGPREEHADIITIGCAVANKVPVVGRRQLVGQRPRSWWKTDGERVGRNVPELEARRARKRGMTGIGRLSWSCQLHPELTEAPMTDERMALVELLQKSGDSPTDPRGSRARLRWCLYGTRPLTLHVCAYVLH
jgi:hypothetical protein